jgi:hypothetical protein
MKWQESADETPQANSNTRPEMAPNNVVSRDYLELYCSPPGKTTTGHRGGVRKSRMPCFLVPK